jgi:imidazoleglycerol-phosphate dehydratase
MTAEKSSAGGLSSAPLLEAASLDPTGFSMRTARVSRRTNETDVAVALVLDGTGKAEIATGVGFLDHMLELFARHGLFDIEIKVTGDLHVDQHHTTEDTGIALGQAFLQALGDKKGIARYADIHLPMDETLSRVAVDISGRPFLVFKATFPTQRIGAFDTELVREWFQAFAMNGGVTLHVETLYGDNSHHIAESCFKGLARALRAAVALDPREQGRVPSTKGAL